MFRFLATLLVTGVGLLAASAWWSGRDAGPWPELPAAEPETSAPVPDGAEPEPAATEPEPAASPAIDPGPEPRRRALAAREPAATRAREPAATRAPERPALAPIPGVPAPAPAPRRVPPIPAPEPAALAAVAGQATVATPMPDEPAPIPAPFAPEAPPPRPADAVGETRIPEPGWFEDEVLDVAAFEEDEGFYGEENVIYNEADEIADGAEAPPTATDEQLAMNDGRDAEARRIRRLLDVYESLRSRR